MARFSLRWRIITALLVAVFGIIGLLLVVDDWRSPAVVVGDPTVVAPRGVHVGLGFWDLDQRLCERFDDLNLLSRLVACVPLNGGYVTEVAGVRVLVPHIQLHKQVAEAIQPVYCRAVATLCTGNAASTRLARRSAGRLIQSSAVLAATRVSRNPGCHTSKGLFSTYLLYLFGRGLSH